MIRAEAAFRWSYFVERKPKRKKIGVDNVPQSMFDQLNLRSRKEEGSKENLVKMGKYDTGLANLQCRLLLLSKKIQPR